MGCIYKGTRDSDRGNDLVDCISEQKSRAPDCSVCVWYLEFGTGFSSVEQGNKGKVRVGVETMRLDCRI